MLEEQVRRTPRDVLPADRALVGESAGLTTRWRGREGNRGFSARCVAHRSDILRAIREVDHGARDVTARHRHLVGDDVRQQVSLTLLTAAIGVQAHEAEVRAARVGDDQFVLDRTNRTATAGREHRDAPRTRTDGDRRALEVERVEIEHFELVAFDVREIQLARRLMEIAVGDSAAVGEVACRAGNERDGVTNGGQRVVTAPFSVASEDAQNDARCGAAHWSGQPHSQRDRNGRRSVRNGHRVPLNGRTGHAADIVANISDTDRILRFDKDGIGRFHAIGGAEARDLRNGLTAARCKDFNGHRSTGRALTDRVNHVRHDLIETGNRGCWNREGERGGQAVLQRTAVVDRVTGNRGTTSRRRDNEADEAHLARGTGREADHD